MFKNLRLRLTVWFVCLTLAAYAVTAGIAGLLFHDGLTRALDTELDELIAENIANVTCRDDRLQFTTQPSAIHTRPIKRLASIQVFDPAGRLVSESGPRAEARLFRETTETTAGAHSMRVKSRRLFDGDRQVGFLQVQLPTDQREQAQHHFILILSLTAPVLVLVLSLSGYFFAAVATRPVERAFVVLKNFMIDAGHELNTPVAIAQAVVDNLCRGAPDQANLPRKLETLGNALRRMKDLTEDLIFLARIEARKPTLEPLVATPLNCILDETVEDIRPLYEQKGIGLRVESTSPLWMKGRRSHLQRLILNLLDNALRYNKPGGETTVSLTARGKDAILSVNDTGIGIAPQALARVFDRFYRADESRSRETGGSGLGLSIARAIAESHGGKVEITSELGLGTRVTVVLPADPSLAPHTIPTDQP